MGIVNTISLERRQNLRKSKNILKKWNLEAIKFYLGKIIAILVLQDHLLPIYYGFQDLYAPLRPAPNRLRSGVRKVPFSSRMQTTSPHYWSGLERKNSFSSPNPQEEVRHPKWSHMHKTSSSFIFSSSWPKFSHHDLFSCLHLLGSKATLTSFLYDSLFLLMTLLPNSLQ